MTLNHIFTTALTFAAFAVSSSIALADLAKPNGPVILTIAGNIEHTNVNDTAQFDRAMLEAMAPVSFTTTTIWTEGEQEFVGVSLKELLEVVGNNGSEIDAIAFNDYAFTIPASDAVEGGPIVAYLMNGKEMPRRGKGPLWVVYPYDDKVEYRSETTYSRSVWQLDRLTAK